MWPFDTTDYTKMVKDMTNKTTKCNCEYIIKNDERIERALYALLEAIGMASINVMPIETENPIHDLEHFLDLIPKRFRG